VLCALAACRSRSDAASSALTDDFGATIVRGSAGHPARIVSLSPATTELLFAIGAGPRVVGRTTWDTYPAEARAVPDVGAGLRPNVEAVLARRPDLVVLYASADNRAADAQLRAAGVPVISLKIDRIAAFRRAAMLLGLATGDSAQAALVVDSVQRTLDRVRAATSALERPTVFWHVWDAPIYTIGAGSYLDELLAIAGAKNVYADIDAPSPQVSLEDIVRRDPRFILAGPEGAAHIRANEEWQGVRAVREHRVLVVDTMLVGRPSVRLGEAALSLAKLLHPGAIK
jgi:ABC-type Fe3+-hydroxamate transport system substrate-binding protein